MRNQSLQCAASTLCQVCQVNPPTASKDFPELSRNDRTPQDANSGGASHFIADHATVPQSTFLGNVKRNGFYVYVDPVWAARRIP